MKESLEKKLSKKKEEKEKIEMLRDEIRGIIKAEKEMQKKGESFAPRLLVINPDDLTQDDLEIFSKYKRRVWTEAEFSTYTDKVTEDLTEKSDNSRDNFRDWIAEKAMLQFSKEQTQEKQEMDN